MLTQDRVCVGATAIRELAHRDPAIARTADGLIVDDLLIVPEAQFGSVSAVDVSDEVQLVHAAIQMSQRLESLREQRQCLEQVNFG